MTRLMRMRGAMLVLVLVLAPACAGCRVNTGTQGMRIDLGQAARLMRAYGSASSSTPAPREIGGLTPERLNDLGVMLERRGMLERAQEHYRKAVERKPSFARAWVNLGNVVRQRGRPAEALECYRRAMREDPGLFEAVNNFADLSADMDRGVDEAMALLAPALDKHPAEENAGRDTLGRLLMRAGRYPEAAAALRSALDLTDPRDTGMTAEMLRHLAQAYRALGDRDAARSAELRAAALQQ